MHIFFLSSSIHLCKRTQDIRILHRMHNQSLNQPIPVLTPHANRTKNKSAEKNKQPSKKNLNRSPKSHTKRLMNREKFQKAIKKQIGSKRGSGDAKLDFCHKQKQIPKRKPSLFHNTPMEANAAIRAIPVNHVRLGHRQPPKSDSDDETFTKNPSRHGDMELYKGIRKGTRGRVEKRSEGEMLLFSCFFGQRRGYYISSTSHDWMVTTRPLR